MDFKLLKIYIIIKLNWTQLFLSSCWISKSHKSNYNKIFITAFYHSTKYHRKYKNNLKRLKKVVYDILLKMKMYSVQDLIHKILKIKSK